MYYDEDLFVKITALGSDLEHANTEGEPIEWGGQRAWFDEHMTLLGRRRQHERGDVGQGAGGGDPPDSYMEWDFEYWEFCQGELSLSVAAGVHDRVELPELLPLPVIISVKGP